MVVRYKIPKGEIAWVSYNDSDGVPHFLMTSSLLRDVYYLYSIDDKGDLKELGKDSNPCRLEEKYQPMETIEGSL